MADKIRGITIELSGDTSGLTKSLQNANKEIKNTQDQLKDVERLLKLDPENTELLRQKQVLLGQAISETKDKLDTLKQAEEQMKSQGVDENSEQFMALQREIAATEGKIEDAQSELDKFNKTGLDKITSQFDTIAEKADAVAEKTRGISTAAGVALGAVGAAATKSVKDYAEYEQAVGGVQTLFGKDWKRVLNNANAAFKTSGKSTTDYLNTVIGFSASLISSLEGDTNKAASLADQAIIDMADNVNKMGTSAESVQNAYRGFARGQFNMLDNLALGYGGTAKEMERLLADAEKISGKEYSIKSYADIIEAIHVIQENLGIAGATAQEAESTISGSFASAQAALENLITGMSDADANVGQLADNVITSVKSVADNIIPVLENIWNNLPDWAQITIGIIGVTAAISPVATAISSVSSAISFLLANPVVLLIAAIVGLVALIVTKGDEIKAVLQNVDDFLTNIFATDFSEEFGILGDVINIFVGIFNGIWTTVKGTLDGVIDFVKGVFSGDWDRAWTGIKEIVDGVLDGIQKTFDAVTGWMSDIFQKDWSESLGAVGEVLNGLFTSVNDVWEDIKSIFTGIIDFIKNVFSGDWGAAWENVKTVFSGIFESLADVAKTPINVIIGLINGLIDGINWVIDGINSISFDVPSWVPGIGGAHVGFNLGKIAKLAYLAQGGILTAGSAVVGEQGPELLTMMGDRAVVQPLTNNTTTTNMGGLTINVYGAAGQNVQELADIIMEEIAAATERREAAFA